MSVSADPVDGSNYFVFESNSALLREQGVIHIVTC